MSIKVIILGGFLGSGKTSVLIQLAKFLVDFSHGGENKIEVVIIENEIGSVGVDNLLLDSAELTVKNLFAGCACCTSSAQLTDSIQAIEKEFNPEWMIIEATGLANPVKIKKTVEEELELKVSTIALVDTKRWFRLVAAMANFVSEQLQDTIAVLINKIDLVEADDVEKVTESIRGYNPDAQCYPISAAGELLNEFWKELLKRAEIEYGE
ncbi:cobalamin biosynthesis protein P47K [Dehalobacter sp. DCM]|uniref:GTP-binding protein n=1 Tax=Dehalobacter sp. DCM TaxID=2907827 RepID=UPI003081D787|nr:cobalamin biosynthesis protein P47K [Dehalobacter sp. DCM]